MDDLKFEWDVEKDSSNRKQHGISFAEARTVFFDDFARLIHDPNHSGQDERFILIGFSSLIRLLVVSHCYSKE